MHTDAGGAARRLSVSIERQSQSLSALSALVGRHQGRSSVVPEIDNAGVEYQSLSQGEFPGAAVETRALRRNSHSGPHLSHDSSKWEQWCHSGRVVLASTWFQAGVGMVIVMNAIVLGLETDDPTGKYWEIVEFFMLCVFTTELGMRLVFIGPRYYFDMRNNDIIWNVFDFILVSLGLFDLIAEAFAGDHEKHHLKQNDSGVTDMVRMIRLLRILRVFRIMRFVKKLYILAYGFGLAAVAVFWVAVLMTAALYICAVVLVRTLGRLEPENKDFEFFQHRFGSVKQAMFTLFQLTVQPNLDEYHDILMERPFFAFFLVCFVFFGSLGMIALLTGVLNEAMFEKNMLRLEEDRADREQTCESLVGRCSEMFDDIDREHFVEGAPGESEGEANSEGVREMLPEIRELFEEHRVAYTTYDLDAMVSVMDTDGSGAISRNEFCRGVLQMAQDIRPMLVMELHHEGMTFHKSKASALETSVLRLQQQLSELLQQQLRELPELLLAELAEMLPGLGAASIPTPRPRSRSHSDAQAYVQSGSLPANDVAVAGLQSDVQALQGDIFSLGARFEELIDDARCERTQSQLAELAELRRSRERVVAGYDEALAAEHLEAALMRCEALSAQLEKRTVELAGVSETLRGRGSEPGVLHTSQEPGALNTS